MLLLISILMTKILSKNLYSEKLIIDNFFKKLNLNKVETFNFENDAAYLNINKNYKTVVTTDTIVENVDFFSNDPPESIAHKIVTVNLSDISSMGALPKTYTLNLSISPKVNSKWLDKFTDSLWRLQKKYNIFLLGGDISRSKEINITGTFFGQVFLKNIISQKKCKLDDDIWVTGNLGNSYLGFKLLENSNLNLDQKLFKNFIKNYYYPNPCMFGFPASKYINAAIDISDGFYGDISKILNYKYGAKINKKLIPMSNNLKKILINNKSLINLNDILNWGDDYELIFTSHKINRNKLIKLSKKHNIKLSKIGTIIKQVGIFDDSLNPIKNINSFDHFR